MGAKDKVQQAAEQAKAAASRAVENARPRGGADEVKDSLKEAGRMGRRAFATLVDRIDPSVLASVIIKATAAQEKANRVLEDKESPYRIGEIAITATIPPQITFTIIRGQAENAVDSAKLLEQGVVDGAEAVALEKVPSE